VKKLALTLFLFTLLMGGTYSPKKDAVERIASVKEKVKILVVFGYWCPDSQRNVPRFFTVMWAAKNPNISYELVPVARGKNPLREKLNIERIPTFIIYRGEREIGRLVENPRKTLEEDLAEILTGSGS